MRFKPEVKLDGLHWEVGYALGFADTLRENLVVTSALDGTHNLGSLHPRGYAADIRTKDLPLAEALAFFDKMKAKLYPLGFDVCWEGGVGATPATTGAHVHVEYDPKPGRSIRLAVSDSPVLSHPQFADSEQPQTASQ